MNLFVQLRTDIIKHIASLDSVLDNSLDISLDKDVLNKFSIEIPKEEKHGDFATNIALLIAAKQKSSNRRSAVDIAIEIKTLLSEIDYIASIDIAGPGFINFFLKTSVWQNCLKSIISNDKRFYNVNIGCGKKLNIEYVSANPTGPLHIGHARGAVYGDVLARLLSNVGYNVTKEYYINDAGSQVQTLIQTVLIRYRQHITSVFNEIPQGLYPGEYLIPIGQALFEAFGNRFVKDALTQDDIKCIKEFTIDQILNSIKSDLHELGIFHDVFFSEQYLHDNGYIESAVNALSKDGLIYQGTLPPPKGQEDPNWKARVQTLFKSTNFGDDQDRPIQKSDGSWSYLAGDIAYAKNKIERGFEILLYILGADHSPKVMEAVLKAISKNFSKDSVKSHVKLCQLVNLLNDGRQFKMSKRDGTFVTLKEVLDKVGKDIIRFMMLTRKNDMVLDFDLQKVHEQSKENPVFYVQYAYVRTHSILSNAEQLMPKAYEKFANGAAAVNLELLNLAEEIQLIKLLSTYPQVITEAAIEFEPHKIAFYIMNISARLHGLWNFCKEGNDYRFVVQNDVELTASRLLLIGAVQQILSICFNVIGITPLTKM